MLAQAEFLTNLRKNPSKRRKVQPLYCTSRHEFLYFWPEFNCFRHNFYDVYLALDNSLLYVDYTLMREVERQEVGYWQGVVFKPLEDYIWYGK